MVTQLEQLMFKLSDFFLAPVLFLIALLFLYSLYAVGQFVMQALQRRKARSAFAVATSASLGSKIVALGAIKGYPLAVKAHCNPSITTDELDVAALEELETVRAVSRLAPMLGLIATMVPMGPALKSLANGNVQGISDNLIVAFSAVIFGLVIASITFWIASVKKRWLAAELVALAPQVKRNAQVMGPNHEVA